MLGTHLAVEKADHCWLLSKAKESASAVSTDSTSSRAEANTSGSERNQSTNPFSVLASRTRSGAATGSGSPMPADAGSSALCYCPMECLALRWAVPMRTPLQCLPGQGCVVADCPRYALVVSDSVLAPCSTPVTAQVGEFAMGGPRAAECCACCGVEASVCPRTLSQRADLISATDKGHRDQAVVIPATPTAQESRPNTFTGRYRRLGVS